MTDAAHPRHDEGRRPWAAAGALYLAMFMTVLDISVVNLALPDIRKGLEATDTGLEWVLVIYLLGFAALLLPFGRFGDVAGRDRVFRWGLIGFTLASLGCGLAPDIGTLIAARALQGLSAAAMVPQVLAIVHVIFDDTEKGRAIGLFGSVSALGAVAGPIVGGLLVSADLFSLGWRPIFLINLPIGLAAYAGSLRFLPALSAQDRVAPDLAGSILFALAVLALVFPLVEGRRFGWPVWIFCLWIAAAGLGLAFLLVQRYRARAGLAQLLPLALTRDPVFLAGLAGAAAVFSALAGLYVTLSIFLQSGAGLSARDAGLTLVPHPLGVMVASYLGGRFGGRWQGARMAAGALAVLCGLAALRPFLGVPEEPGIAWSLMAQFLMVGLGTGLMIPPLFQRVLSRVGQGDAGAGSGALQAFQQVGMALGIALQGQIFFQVLGAERSPEAYLAAERAAVLYPTAVFAALVLALGIGAMCRRLRRPEPAA